MIKKIKNSIFMRFAIFLMMFSIFLVSCDPTGNLRNEYLLNNEIDNELSKLREKHSPEEIQKFEKSFRSIKAYVLARNNRGADNSITRIELMDYVLDKAIENGEIEEVTLEKRKALHEIIDSDFQPMQNYSSQKDVTSVMVFNNEINAAEKSFLDNFEDNLKNIENKEEITSFFENYRIEANSNTDLSPNFINYFEGALNQVELGFLTGSFDDLENVNNVNIHARGDCDIINCIAEYQWQFAVVSLVIGVIAIALAIFTLGFSLLLSIITLVVIVLVIVITCVVISILCDPEPCNDGLKLTCHPLYHFNAEGTMCISEVVTKIINFGMFSDPTSGNQCPNGSIFVGAGCWWGQINDAPFDELTSDDVGTNPNGTTFHRPICL